MRRNRSETAQRRSHHAISAVRTSTCECGAKRIPHRACATCGKYNGRVVIDIVARAKRQQRRSKRKHKELRESGQETGVQEKQSTAASS